MIAAAIVTIGISFTGYAQPAQTAEEGSATEVSLEAEDDDRRHFPLLGVALADWDEGSEWERWEGMLGDGVIAGWSHHNLAGERDAMLVYFCAPAMGKTLEDYLDGPPWNANRMIVGDTAIDGTPARILHRIDHTKRNTPLKSIVCLRDDVVYIIEYRAWPNEDFVEDVDRVAQAARWIPIESPANHFDGEPYRVGITRNRGDVTMLLPPCATKPRIRYALDYLFFYISHPQRVYGSSITVRLNTDASEDSLQVFWSFLHETLSPEEQAMVPEEAEIHLVHESEGLQVQRTGWIVDHEFECERSEVLVTLDDGRRISISLKLRPDDEAHREAYIEMFDRALRSISIPDP